jgi:hypothetical protein
MILRYTIRGMNTVTLITEGEVAVMLGMSPSGVSYLAETGKLRPVTRRRGRRLYAISDVQAFAVHRQLHPERRGRPSPAKLLQRRQLLEVH